MIFRRLLTLKDPGFLVFQIPGGGGNPPIGQEIACCFSQDHDHAMVTKILEFINKHSK